MFKKIKQKIESKRNSDSSFWKNIIRVKDFVFWGMYWRALLLSSKIIRKIKWTAYLSYNFNPLFNYSNFKERKNIKKIILIPQEGKINLLDFVFIIPVRYDSINRKINLERIISFIKRFFNTEIILIEEDVNPHFKYLKKSLNYFFIKSKSKFFHRTKVLNYAIKRCKKEYVAIYDSDVLLNPINIYYAAKMLRENLAQVVYPHNGDFMDISKEESKKITSNKSWVKPKSLNKRIAHSVGGAYFASKFWLINAGMENENFISWGAEDNERYERFKKLGYKIKRTNSPLFHLYHPINLNSSPANLKYNQNKKELLRIQNMNKTQLIKEIKSWKWVK